jgi:hypothetical protein
MLCWLDKQMSFCFLSVCGVHRKPWHSGEVGEFEIEGSEFESAKTHE